jgi:hypothetical protein
MRKNYALVEQSSSEQVVPADLHHADVSVRPKVRADSSTIEHGRRIIPCRFGYFSYVAIHTQSRLAVWFLRTGRSRFHEIKRSLFIYTSPVLSRATIVL